MEQLKSLLNFIKSLPIVGKVISTIIVLLIFILFTFFSGCAYKFHADGIDNVTREIYFNGGK